MTSRACLLLLVSLSLTPAARADAPHPARWFNSKLKLRVTAVLPDGTSKFLGATPAPGKGIRIPACRTWSVGLQLGDPRRLAKLLREQAIPGLRLHSCGVEQFEALGGLKTLRSLRVWAFRGTDRELARGLAALPDGLTELHLGPPAPLTDAGLTALLRLKDLRELTLPWGRRLSAAALARLPSLRALERLSMPFCPNLEDRTVAALAKLPGLRELNLPGCYLLTDAGVRPLLATKLRRLDLSACPRVSAALVSLFGARCRQDGALRCPRTRPMRWRPPAGVTLRVLVPDHWSPSLVPARSGELTVPPLPLQASVEGDSAAQLNRALRALAPLQPRHLYVDHQPVTDAELALLAAMPALRELSLMGALRITDRGIAALSSLKQLRELDLTYCPLLTTRATKALRKALPRCRITADVGLLDGMRTGKRKSTGPWCGLQHFADEARPLVGPVLDPEGRGRALLPRLTAAEQASVQRLLRQLGAPRYADRQAATRALVRLGRRIGRPLLRHGVPSKDPEVAWRSKRVFDTLFPIPPRPAEREDPDRPRKPPSRLARLFAHPAECVREESGEADFVRFSASLALAVIGTQQSVPPLVAALLDGDQDVHLAADFALRSLLQRHGVAVPDTSPTWRKGEWDRPGALAHWRPRLLTLPALRSPRAPARSRLTVPTAAPHRAEIRFELRSLLRETRHRVTAAYDERPVAGGVARTHRRYAHDHAGPGIWLGKPRRAWRGRALRIRATEGGFRRALDGKPLSCSLPDLGFGQALRDCLPAGQYLAGRPRPLGWRHIQRLATLIVPGARLGDHAGALTLIGRTGELDRYHLVVLLVVRSRSWGVHTTFALGGTLQVVRATGALDRYALDGLYNIGYSAQAGGPALLHIGRCRTRFERE